LNEEQKKSEEKKLVTGGGPEKTPKLLWHLADGKYIFYCPGCKCHHWFTSPRWIFNGDYNKPSVTPNIITNPQDARQRCDLQIIEGRLRYLTDSFHYLSGISVDMTDLTELEQKWK